jgi:ABC-type phosphate transport system substrate-binding protein
MKDRMHQSFALPRFRSFWVALPFASALFTAGAASAAPCGDLSNSVVVVGSSAIQPLVAALAQLLTVPTPGSESIRILYRGAGSCTGVQALLDPASFQPTELATWDAAGTQTTCTVEPGAPLGARIGVSDVFPATCTALSNGLPDNVADFHGPVQAMVLVVPRSSVEVAISAEAAYSIFGFGSDSGVAPWIDESVIFRRNAESGTQSMIAAAIGVPAARWRGVATSGTEALVQALLGVSVQRPEGALGILVANAADENRATLRTLAFQNFGETCAVLPDRTASSEEKENVRKGTYPIWGPLHLLSNVDANRRPTSPQVEQTIGYLLGNSAPLPGLDMISLEAKSHIVPQCAMRVTRSYEAGPIEPFAPSQPCGCYYEAVANGSTGCTTCTGNHECPARNICSYGYCEAL